MNQMKVDNFISTRQWQQSKSFFHNHSVDTLILQIYFIITALAIAISIGALLWRLLKNRRKTRADKIFIILSCSDIDVGLFSIQLVSIPLFKWDAFSGSFQHLFLTSFHGY